MCGTNPLTVVLGGRWAALRRDVRAQQAANGYLEPRDAGTEEYRAWVLEQLRTLAKTGHPRLGFAREYDGGDIGASVVSFEMLGYGDLSLMVKAGVQWGLFGGAVQLLGTQRHHEQYLARIMDLDLPGCFAMTESGHGSDVQHVCTTATYDRRAREFVIDTPDLGARKDYIGNAVRRRHGGRAAGQAARSVRPVGGRGGPRVVPGARPYHRFAYEGGDRGGERPVPPAAAARPGMVDTFAIPEAFLRAEMLED
ncbi:hypothetical protein FG385_01205 [Amycolatopsis alkalitolerans]|uniref:Acyl-CoA dehydrogenase/oxidase N-terminal domain-containing protein n=1 Tax=Amycolatopsis alkalitolerans TaxID=2547244 RepID=A0A5C4MC63_9PSEU|nr:hypothetical protein FG385_01205 [Amycolatopsis alkalitolerans]